MNFLTKTLATAVLALGLTSTVAKADVRDFKLYNDTNYDITSVWLSSEDDPNWNRSRGSDLKAHYNETIQFDGAGSCIVQVRITFRNHEEATWTDGFDLCSTGVLRVRARSNGILYIDYN